jgi:adenylate kinase family enzyme
VELAQRKTLQSEVKNVLKTGEINEQDLAEKLKQGQITEDGFKILVDMAPSAQQAVQERDRYASDKSNPSFTGYRSEVLKSYFKKNIKGTNVAMKREKSDEIFAEISQLPLGSFAKADLYAEHLKVLSIAGKESDSGMFDWLDNEVAENLTDPQRTFWTDYMESLSVVVSQSNPMTDIGEALQRNVMEFEQAIQSSDGPKTAEEFGELKRRMITPFLKGAAKRAIMGGDLPTVDTKEQFDALPSGAVFIDSADGKQYRKP